VRTRGRARALRLAPEKGEKFTRDDEIITPAGAGPPYRSTLSITSPLQFNGAPQSG
jgi:hypothetical protein